MEWTRRQIQRYGWPPCVCGEGRLCPGHQVLLQCPWHQGLPHVSCRHTNPWIRHLKLFSVPSSAVVCKEFARKVPSCYMYAKKKWIKFHKQIDYFDCWLTDLHLWMHIIGHVWCLGWSCTNQMRRQLNIKDPEICRLSRRGCWRHSRRDLWWAYPAITEKSQSGGRYIVIYSFVLPRNQNLNWSPLGHQSLNRACTRSVDWTSRPTLPKVKINYSPKSHLYCQKIGNLLKITKCSSINLYT